MDGSRVRSVASACLVVSGLIIAGAGGALALAEPGDSGGEQTNDTSVGTNGEQTNTPIDRDTKEPSTKTEDPSPTKTNESTRTKTEDPSPTKTEESTRTKTGPGPATRRATEESTPTKTEESTPTKTEESTPTKTEESTTTRSTTTPTTTTPTTTTPTTTSVTTTSATTTTPTTTPTTTSTDSTSGGGSEGGGFELPDGRPDPPPDMQIPPPRDMLALLGLLVEPAGVGAAGAATGGPLAAATGSAAGATLAGPAAVPVAPITLPVVVGPSIGLGGAVAPGAPTRPMLPGAPRPDTTGPSAGREPLPTNIDNNVAVPASFRVGYDEYLRAAGTSQLVALAVPGVAGILALTGVGGLVGYRQAKAGNAVRTGGAARFVS